MKINNYKNLNSVRILDLALASFLNLYFPLIGIEKISDIKVAFLFEETEELKEAVRGFYNDQVKVSPLKYFTSLKYLKSRLHGGY